MRNYLLLLVLLLLGMTGCCSYSDIPYTVIRNNEIDESIVPMKNYSIYNYESQVRMTRDKEEYLPAHYYILIPPKRSMKKFLSQNENRCFLYTKLRGIAIFQDEYPWERVYTNGFRQIPADSAEFFLNTFDNQVEIKIKEQKNHYLYVDNEIRIVIFNLSKEDYNNYVEFPLKNLFIKRRGEIRIRSDAMKIEHNNK